MLRSVKVPGLNYWGPMRMHAHWRQVAIFERPSSGIPQCATEFDGPGQPLLRRQPDTDGAITVSNLWDQVRQRIENIGLAAVSPLVDLPKPTLAGQPALSRCY
jgi:hypothetical protein